MKKDRKKINIKERKTMKKKKKNRPRKEIDRKPTKTNTKKKTPNKQKSVFIENEELTLRFGRRLNKRFFVSLHLNAKSFSFLQMYL